MVNLSDRSFSVQKYTELWSRLKHTSPIYDYMGQTKEKPPQQLYGRKYKIYEHSVLSDFSFSLQRHLDILTKDSAEQLLNLQTTRETFREGGFLSRSQDNV